MFADDTNLFFSHCDIKLLFQTMNAELQNISYWFKANKLSFNIAKTKWSLFHPNNKKRFIPQLLPKLSIENIVIKRENITKFLGVYIDENLTWKTHIENIGTKISKSIGILYKSRHILHKQHLNMLYFSFIRSYLNYVNMAWASTYKTKLASLYRYQTHAVRVINFKDRFTHAKPLLESINALTVYEINIFQILCLMNKCQNQAAPSAFNDLFVLKPQSSYSLPSNNVLLEPFSRTKLSQFCISFRGPHLWNKFISQNTLLCKIQYLPLFKIKVKEMISCMNNITDFF